MSTLATNKLGTLAGTADMSLPTSRPSSTKAAYLDSSGNLTFEESSVKCEFIVIDGTTKVTKVLVDVYTQAMDNQLSVLYDSSGNLVYGADLGTWNLPGAISTNYFQDGNIRWFDLQGNGQAYTVASGSKQYGKFSVQMLDSSKSIILGDIGSTQEIAYSQWTVSDNTTSAATGSGNSSVWYNDNDNANYGQNNASWQGMSGGSAGPAPWFFYIRFIPWWGARWKYGGRYTAFGDNASYGPRQSWGYTQPQMNQDVSASGASRGFMGAHPAGVSVNVFGNGSSDTKNYGFANFTLTATIKPTTVVTA